MYEGLLAGASVSSFELVSGGVPFWDYLGQPGNEGAQKAFDR